LRAIGRVAQTKILVNLQKALLTGGSPQKFSLPRIIGEKSCRGDSHRLIGESRAQLAIIAPDLALIREGERVNNVESFPFHSTRAWNESLGYSPLERPIHRSKLNRRHAELMENPAMKH